MPLSIRWVSEVPCAAYAATEFWMVLLCAGRLYGEMMKRLLVFGSLLLSFLLGAMVVYFDLGPSAVVKEIVHDAGARFGLSPRPALDPRFNFKIRVDSEQTGTGSYRTIKDDGQTFKSLHFDTPIVVRKGVFLPTEAELNMLPMMQRIAPLFEGADVMEIGAGAGLVSMKAAQLGANKVVSTDILQPAIESISVNAKNLGFASIVESRQVPLDDISAYAVIGADEKFDVIIGNPPFALDLDAVANNALTDTGELGFSIINGLEKHLKPGGIAVLFYDSLFYHAAIVKYARYKGYDVVNHEPNGFYPWAAESLFNNYLQRLLVSEGLPADAFEFDWHKDSSLRTDFLRNAGLRPPELGFEPLFPPPSQQIYYAGVMVIREQAK
jgi:16S rRNA G966 N2-methylase RsmD